MTHGSPRIESLAGRAGAAVVLLQISTAANVLCIFAQLFSGFVLFQIAQGVAFDQTTLQLMDSIETLTLLGSALIFLVSAVMVLRWMRTAYRNLPALGASRCETTVGWLTAYWFLPIANLFKPYQVMEEIAAKSRNAKSTGNVSSLVDGDPLPLGLWWTAWLVGSVVNRIAGKIGERTDDAMTLFIANGLGAVGDIFLVAAAIFLIKIIREITSRQERSFTATAS